MTRNGARLKVLHCITSLDPDGAQNMLLKLCESLPREHFEMHIVNLRGPTPFTERFGETGASIDHLGMRRSVPSLRALRSLVSIIRDRRPDVIQGWMYHGNLAATLAASFVSPRPPVLWNIRKAVADLSEYRLFTRLTLRAGALLSRKADAVIYCGEYIARQHLGLGYLAENAAVIPNGFDTARFAPNPDAAAELRARCGIRAETAIVGMAARFHPHKDHLNFLDAAAKVAKARDTVFVLAGRGLDDSNTTLLEHAERLGIRERLRLLGDEPRVERVIAGLDVYCQSSSAEGFPNALGEAMSCAIPCVSTDAGASAEAVGDAGLIVPTRNSSALASAILEVLALERDERLALGARARERIVGTFSIPAVAERYRELYERFAAPREQEIRAESGPRSNYSLSEEKL